MEQWKIINEWWGVAVLIAVGIYLLISFVRDAVKESRDQALGQLGRVLLKRILRFGRWLLKWAVIISLVVASRWIYDTFWPSQTVLQNRVLESVIGTH
jgi:hypothetical protein